jgi:hypothetical protein
MVCKYRCDIQCGGSQKQITAIIEQSKAENGFEGEYKNNLLQDFERAKYFSAFGIGYNGYCKKGLAELEAILNGK